MAPRYGRLADALLASLVLSSQRWSSPERARRSRSHHLVSAFRTTHCATAHTDLLGPGSTRQQQLGVKIYDYVNYIAPRGTAGLSKNGGWDSSKYYGPNIARLQTLKQKYDPKCLLHKGPTFASTQCKAEGWASWW